MGITFKFPTPLDMGHSIAVIGEVGRTRFVLKLVSDFKVFDPDLPLPASPSSLTPESPVQVPVSETTPLEVTLDTSGEWEVCASTPETSSNASGFNAARNGFRTGELFICKICVKKDFFEVYLNGLCLSLSEHMIPVGWIQSVVIEGDCRIGRMLYGDAIAVEKSARRSLNSLSSPLETSRIPTPPNLEEATVIECLVQTPDIEADLDLTKPLFPLSEYSPERNINSKHVESGHQPSAESDLTATTTISSSLTNLHRAASYQLVFDVSDNEDDDTTEEPILNRASSCCNLTTPSINVIHRPSFLIPPKPVPQRHRYLNQLLPIQNDFSRLKSPRSVTAATPVETSRAPTRPLIARTGFAIKVSHPAIQVDGKSASPHTPSASASSPSISRPTRDFLSANDQRSPRLPSGIPIHAKKVSNSSGLRRRGIPLSIR
ncbi:hypothetical protein TSMEX_002240 [Taenia solium]|eukprot:TsM_000700300 transcript=TsM_000700300 gene=TsM_000700300